MAGARLSLVVYTDATTIGGAELSLANLVQALPTEVEVTAVGVAPPVLDTVVGERRAARVRVAKGRALVDPVTLAEHVRVMRQLRPDVCHVNLRTPYSCGYGVAAALLLPHARVVAVEHLPLPSLSRSARRLKRLSSRRLAAHVAVGDRAARLVEQDAELPAGSIRTIHNGVPKRPRPVEVRRLAAGPVIGSVGRLDRQKGFDVLVSTLTRLPGVTAVLVGDGPCHRDLERLARESGVADRVVLPGWSDEPWTFLHGFDVFVLPSRFEGFPLAIVEAMRASLPVVATSVGSVGEAVVDGVTGRLVPPDDPAALACALRQLIDDPDTRVRLGHAGRKRAEELFSLETMTRAYVRLYEEVLGDRVTRRRRRPRVRYL